jgi:hypothetical protein
MGKKVVNFITDNDLRAYVRWRLEALTFQYGRKFDRRTNVELTTEPPLAYTRCYALVADLKR